jgi:cytidylate kinase
MQRRDLQDSRRQLAPLKPAADAMIIDATQLSIDAVVQHMLSRVQTVLDRV